MSLVGFTFGSFGDLVTATSLALKVRRALADSTGASEEYQALLAQVDSFYGVLQAVADLLSSNRKSNALPDSVVREVLFTISLAVKVLGEIHGMVMSCKKKLHGGGYRQTMEDSWRKIGWAVLRPRDLAEMRERLARHLGRILALLRVLDR